MHTDVSLADLGATLATDDTAVERAYVLLAPSVLGYLRRLLPAADAEDALQRTFLDVWRCRDQYDPARPLAGWVFGIARHRAMDMLRARREVLEADPFVIEAEEEDLAERYARSALIRDALERINAEQRQVLMLTYFDDLTLRQVAEWVDAPLGTIKARAARGLRALARELGRDNSR